MKILKQFFIILVVSCVGELLNVLLPLPIPASIYGMVLLFGLLYMKILKLEDIRDTGYFLIEIMPVMFIPAGVGLMSSWGVLKPVLIPVSIITIASTILVMACGGRITQFVIKHSRSTREDSKNE